MGGGKKREGIVGAALFPIVFVSVSLSCPPLSLAFYPVRSPYWSSFHLATIKNKTELFGVARW